jgi:hypothetical protein
MGLTEKTLKKTALNSVIVNLKSECAMGRAKSFQGL